MEIQSAETTPNSLVIPPFISPRDRLTTRDIFPSRFFKDLSIADLEDNRAASRRLPKIIGIVSRPRNIHTVVVFPFLSFLFWL